MDYKIASLEQKLELPVYFENKVVIPEDNKVVVYVGRVMNFNFSGDIIWGDVRLSKYDRSEITHDKKRLVQWFPPRFQTEPVTDVKEVLVWSFPADPHSSKCLVYKGKSCTEYTNAIDYRAALISVARDNGLVLLPRLFDLVFDPIDLKLLDLYKQAYR